MGLIPAIIAGAAAIVSAAVVKVIADDAKEWTPWITRRLLDIAVRRLPNGQRERYAEEWAAHLAEVPGVVGKMAVSVQFRIAAFGARELDAKTRLDAWRNERVAVATLVRIQAMAGEVLSLVNARRPLDEADEDTLEEQARAMRGVLKEFVRRFDELDARRPVLGITVAGANLMGERIFGTAYSKVMTTAKMARSWPLSVHCRVHRMLGQLDK